MSYPPILLPDISLVGVFDANIPNRERIVLRPNRQISMGGVGIAVGFDAGANNALVVYDNVFWFPQMTVEPPVWIFLYSGRGEVKQTTVPSGEPALVFHWQRPNTVFVDPKLVPVVFRAADVIVGRRFSP